MKRILILGSDGMLGQEFSFLALTNPNNFFFTTRSGRDIFGNSCFKFDCETDNLDFLLSSVKPEYVINCIGLVKQKIDEISAETFQKAIEVNAFFPKILGQLANKYNYKVIQIATDCVFNGEDGNYIESDLHTANDIYGITKSLGEVVSPHFLNLRVSIIGKAIKSKHSILNWLLIQKQNSLIKGYSNHIWNGITSLAFAKICIGIIKNDSFRSGIFHIVPGDKLSKYDLLFALINKFNRTDLQIEKFELADKKDLSLLTMFPSINSTFWLQAGYSEPPSIKYLVNEMTLPELI